jgi:stage IV sporulation protein FB
VTPQESPPASSPFDLRWRLLGIRFRIQPSFWIVSALMGWLSMSFFRIGPKNFWLCLLLWVMCTLVSVLVHELGHVIMGRIFGQPGDITLAGLGGQAAGKYEYLRHWERILVALAGPGAGFLFLGLQVLADSSFWNKVLDYLTDTSKSGFFLKAKVNIHLIDWIDPTLRMEDNYFLLAMGFLLMMNLVWNLLNLLPIFPMDGGMVLREVCCILSPNGGQKFAYGFSFLLAASVVIYCLLILVGRWKDVAALKQFPTVIDPIFGAIMFGMLAFQNLSLLRQATAEQKSSHYQEHFED